MTSRLRLAVMASHRPDELRAAAHVLAQAVRAAGFDPRAEVFADDEPDFDERLPAASAPPRTSSKIFDGEVSERLAA
jgi:hypothetical protein